ncbi:TPA: hypothetical protein QCJ95_002228 [Enterobacter asburiae]|nr:hypothetical protein [Enterobacter asburiae]HDR2799085.1 hypothetical protein [Enterobacter asburiae]
MALDIQSGANLQVEIGTPVSGGTGVATDFQVIPSIAAFTTSGFESTVITVKSFDNEYDRKILGGKNIPDISLQVNYISESPAHILMDTMADEQKKVQIKLSYFDSPTRDGGFFVIYNGFLSSTTLAGDKDQVVVKTYTLVVDGGAINAGLIGS